MKTNKHTNKNKHLPIAVSGLFINEINLNYGEQI
tara:strand:- start:1441 stop:1542 length:102 start_codon:yes stop_codon:yes gene_type:complete